MNFDINSPKIRLAFKMADTTGKQQAIIANSFGDYDIKPMSNVRVMDSNFIVMIAPEERLDSVSRFIMFAWNEGQAQGGFRDYVGMFNSTVDALHFIEDHCYDFYQILDRFTFQHVKDNLLEIKN